MLRGIKRFILWDYARASWQYDLMVGLILAFIFLTPRDLFRDQARIPKASHIAALGETRGLHAFWIEPQVVRDVPEASRAGRIAQLLRAQYGQEQTVTRLEPVFDSEQELKGYMAFTKP